MIQMNNVYKKYPNGVVAANGITIDIKQGEFVYVVGPSGAGKSTFIKLMYREEKPTSGEIIFKGKNILEKGTDLTEVRKHIGMVFQSFNLFSHLTIIENVMMPQIDLLNRSKQEAYDKAVELLKSVGLSWHLQIALLGGWIRLLSFA